MQDWDEFVNYHREHTVKAMEKSAYVMSLVPAGEVDVKFAVELGLAIMLEKPIIAMAQPGTRIPRGLSKIADAVIVADLDTEEGKTEAMSQIQQAMSRVDKPA